MFMCRISNGIKQQPRSVINTGHVAVTLKYCTLRRVNQVRNNCIHFINLNIVPHHHHRALAMSLFVLHVLGISPSLNISLLSTPLVERASQRLMQEYR